MPTYDAARLIVSQTVADLRGSVPSETIAISDPLSVSRISAEDVAADRDYPPFHRSTRDGYAVRAVDLNQVPRTLRLLGESKAGTAFDGRVGPGECVQIMTGAPVPDGADAVVMIEFTKPNDTAPDQIVIERRAQVGQNIVPTGSEARAGQILLRDKARLSYAELAILAQVGRARVRVFRRPTVALLSTGDEVVPIEQQPGPFEIRNSNCVSLAAQSVLAGAKAVPLGNAPDSKPELRSLMERGLHEDILVLSGGVSMGKYDLVEEVLLDLGAQFFFDSVDIRPGRPTVFAICSGKPVFGLPGNPVSTMVTFELFVSLAIDILGGGDPRPLPLFSAKLAHDVEEKPGLAHFVPASVSWQGSEATASALAWQGSGDIVALMKSNCFLVVAPPRLKLAAGQWADVLPRRGLF